MNNALTPYEIALIVALVIVQVRIHTSKATRERIIAATRKALLWTLNRGDRFLHALLMSPVKPD